MATESSGSSLPPATPAPQPESPAVRELAVESITIQDLLAAGLHFGHQTKRWNPKMKRYIFDKRNGVHIIDLTKTLVKLREAAAFARDVVAGGRTVLFVGTKKQAQQTFKDAATACGQPYVVTRWLGGTMTNNVTIRRSIKRLLYLDEVEKKNILATMRKKEASRLRHELEKLRRNLTGLVGMTEMPGAVFVADINREANAVAEARRIRVPVIALADTNGNPDLVDYVIPGNDDAIRGINLIVGVMAHSIKKGAAAYSAIAAEQARRAEEARKAREAAPPSPAESAKGDATAARKKPAHKKAAAPKPVEPAAEPAAAPVPAIEPAAAPAAALEEAEDGEFTEYGEMAKGHRKPSAKVALLRSGKDRPKNS
ncbi:MAG: 30S ribosomal protein S2 [Verrucomicrobiota bacterium]|nr:30S ribosomal protein S2 [Verrucomicrobiota bacterium]